VAQKGTEWRGGVTEAKTFTHFDRPFAVIQEREDRRPLPLQSRQQRATADVPKPDPNHAGTSPTGDGDLGENSTPRDARARLGACVRPNFGIGGCKSRHIESMDAIMSIRSELSGDNDRQIGVNEKRSVHSAARTVWSIGAEAGTF
jgi:hypothetical protein